MLTLKIKTDNQAFDDEFGQGHKEAEIINCLNDVIDKIDKGYTDENIHDTNGNVTGHFKLT